MFLLTYIMVFFVWPIIVDKLQVSQRATEMAQNFHGFLYFN